MNARIDLPYTLPGLASCAIPAHRLSAVYRMADVPPAADLVGRARRVAVLVDDMTRPTPVDLILPVVLEELSRRGIRDEQVTVVIALGSHRPMTEEEIRRKVGGQVAGRYRVMNQRFDDPGHLKYIGTSEDGVPIHIEEEVAGADFKIGIGSIVPHGAVGWSGGGKIVYPGVAGKDTVMRFHFAHGLTEENMTGREECPVRLRMERWVDIVGLDFIVNSVLTPDDRVTRVVAGHYRDAQRRGVGLAREVYCQPIRERVDILLSVSYEHDQDFWQAAKGIYGPEALVRDGGTLLLVSPCPEGQGNHPDFLPLIGRDDNRAVLLAILQGAAAPPRDPLPLAPAAMMARMRRRFRCAVVSPGLSGEELAQAGYERFEDVQSAMDTLLKRYPQGRVGVVLRSDLAFF
jgi:hypothetical protein